MITAVLSVLLVALAMTGLAVGMLFGRPLRGGCGGASCDEKGCEIVCRRRQDRARK